MWFVLELKVVLWTESLFNGIMNVILVESTWYD